MRSHVFNWINSSIQYFRLGHYFLDIKYVYCRKSLVVTYEPVSPAEDPPGPVHGPAPAQREEGLQEGKAHGGESYEKKDKCIGIVSTMVRAYAF